MKLAVYLLMPLFVIENGLVEIFLELHKIETVVLNCKVSEHKNRDLTKIIIVLLLNWIFTFYDKRVFVIFANSC